MPARRGGTNHGVPQEGNAGVVCALEEVGEGETRPDDAPRPVVWLDEARPQWVADAPPPRPGQPGHPARQDDEDDRGGTAPLCRLCAPRAGQRHGQGTDPRPNADGAVGRREVADGPYAAAAQIVGGMDQRHPHTLAGLAPGYPPAEARR